MHNRGNLRLLLNARLWDGITATRMDGGKGATFAVVNAAAAGGGADGGGGRGGEGGGGAAAVDTKQFKTYAFRVKSSDLLDAFLAAVEAHKGKKAA